MTSNRYSRTLLAAALSLGLSTVYAADDDSSTMTDETADESSTTTGETVDTDKSMGDFVDDSMISTKVKAGLLTDDTIPGTSV